MNNQLVKIISGDTFTPLSLAKKLNARVILESSTYQKGRERYSLLMIDEAFTLTQRGQEIFISSPLPGDGEAHEVGGSSRGPERRIRSKARDILDVLKYFADQHSSMHQDFPFPAGGIGYCSFEFSRFCDTIAFTSKPDELDLPDASFIFGHSFVVFDHYTDQLYLIALNYREKQINLEKAIARTERRIRDLNFNYLQEEHESYSVEEVSSSDHAESYKEMVEKVRKEVVAGNLLQAVPSRRRRFKTDMPAIEAYRTLRQSNPSPYLFYLDFGNHQLFGASPEVHVKVKEGRVKVRPIAGTRRRGATTAEDNALERELLSDEKEQAEHLMLVDLGRNDLGRVCSPGTVQLSDYMITERYSRVMHIVSEVEGELDEGKTGIDALRATFPAGTVSGAPKIQAIKTIDSLEPVQRRFYSGVVGYVEPGGDLDTCIAIRSALYKDGILNLQAGGGIVFDSKPERELEETQEKMSALLRAIGIQE
ncbi:anthranilate synthase component I [Salinispira pacifica]|uniref:Anthranilate synthase component 1 n=1 Tax=Salinispira pacifica TaxID=1307761 RepID=V5WCV0_9SPIO|nr:anthranilate synthase component I [Salinispira pacifica]AHC13638.1 Anthranilate synthase, aminase component [Salinispira pacifica]